MKQTNEQLISEVARLRLSHEGWVEGDVERRKIFSEMLNAPYKDKGQYDYSRERVLYSWPIIYFALGKLIAKRDYADFTDTIQRHERDLGDLREWREDVKDQLLERPNCKTYEKET